MEHKELDEIVEFVGLGSELAGKYRLDRVLGVGGMGVVVAAEHLQLGETVAIKFLLPRVLGKARAAQRFLREARAVSRLKGANVVRVFDFDLRADGVPFIVMEYLEGEALSAQIKREPSPEPSAAIDDLLEACTALAEAHARGIVHRDLKPANLFVARTAGHLKVIKVLDFGISKVLDPESETDKTTGDHVLGSPPYMSPEQLAHPQSVDHQSDIWSLGVILYEVLTGTLPFPGRSFAETCAHVLQSQQRPANQLSPAIPTALSSVIDTCLKKDRSQRFPSILALARELSPFATERGKRSLATIEALSTIGTPSRPPESPKAPPPTRASSDTAEAASLRLSRSGVDTGTLTAAADSPAPARLRSSPRWLIPIVIAVAALASWVLGRSLFQTRDQVLVDTAITPSSASQRVPAADASSREQPGPNLPPSAAPSQSSSGALPRPKIKRAIGAQLAPSALPIRQKPIQTHDNVFDERR